MTRTEYHSHLCSVILAVFKAEDAVKKKLPPSSGEGRGEAFADEYLHLIADEMLLATPEEELKSIIEA